MQLDVLYNLFRHSKGVSADTRTLKEGEIYFALKGASFDGNEFANQALEKGAEFVVVDDRRLKLPDGYFMMVDDVLTTLQRLANYHRRQYSIPYIGITGSNGKTTTKELLYSVLSKKFRTHYTAGNLNNHIGVPLTLLSMPEETEIVIVEMGANKLGDIRELCKIAEPNYGLITNIGRAHIEGFGSIEGVLRGKSELFQHLLQNRGRVFINSHDEKLNNMSKRFSEPIKYPDKGDFLHLKLLAADPFVTFATADGETHTTQLIGAYNFYNIAAALCIGKFFGVEQKQALEAVTTYVPSINRSQIVKSGSLTLIQDAYNANPDSMKVAIESLGSMKGKKAVILGDMNELGVTTEEEHRKIGKLTCLKNFDRIFFCGPKMKDAKLECPHSQYFEHAENLAKYLETLNFDGFTILVKGSRSMKLEELYPLLLQKSK